MKRFFLAAMLLLSLHLCASAQTDSTALDTIRDRYYRYYYYSWYDTCPRFYDSTFQMGIYNTGFYQIANHLITVNNLYTPHPITVSGLAALVIREEDMPPVGSHEMYYDIDHGWLPEYLSLWQIANYEKHLVGDSLRFDTVTPKIMKLPVNGVSGDSITCLAFEVLFDKPVVVDSTFLIGGTGHSNNHIWDDYGTDWIYNKRLWYAHLTECRYRSGNCDGHCPSQAPVSELSPLNSFLPDYFRDYFWGPFFAIVDFDSITVHSNDSLMGSTAGTGRYSDRTDVTIRAIPEPGFYFRRWNDSVTLNPRTVHLTCDTAFTAFFTDETPLYVDAYPDRAFHGSVSGGGIYWPGDSVTLSATPYEHYRFTAWHDGDTSNPRRFVITQDSSFTAFFEWIQNSIDSPENASPLFSVSPNPARSSVSVSLANPADPGCSLSLRDASGHEVRTLPLPAGSSHTTLSVKNLPVGPYFITLTTPDNSSTLKLILQ